MSWDISEFAKAHQKVIISKQTGGCIEKNILAMENAIHVNITNKMDYKFRDDAPRGNWPLFESFMLLQKLPSFTSMLEKRNLVALSGTAGGLADTSSPQSAGESKEFISSGTSNVPRGSPDDEPSLQPADLPAPIGRKRAKLGRMDDERAKFRAAIENKIVEAIEALVSDDNRRTSAIWEEN